MVIITYTKIKQFIESHAGSMDALNNWFRLVENADWSNFHEAKEVFNSVDAIGNDRYVFNVRGNTYRIVTVIIFPVRTIFIRFVGTHAEYDKIDCSTI